MPALRVCYLLCYKAPDYTRTAALLAALEHSAEHSESGFILDRLINRRRGLLRYPEMLYRLISYRLKHKPDVWVLGFRGHESFLFFYPFLFGQRIVFDEFIILESWLQESESRRKTPQFIVAMLRRYMRWLIKRCQFVLEDSKAHARLAHSLYGGEAEKFLPVPVGAEEAMFYPRQQSSASERLRVFFYGTMLPLHGLDIILGAAKQLMGSHADAFSFSFVGGKGNAESLAAMKQFLSNVEDSEFIKHLEWADYAALPQMIAEADVCLGGPFGDTQQSTAVVTGKTYQFLAMAKPVILSPLEEADYFVDGDNVIVCQRGSVQALVNSLLWCLEHRDNLEDIGVKGRELFDQRFSSKQIADLLVPVLTDIDR